VIVRRSGAIKTRMVDSTRVLKLLEEVKLLAQEYYDLTERPLGVTDEIAEFEAARRLGVQLARPRQEGYDAIRETPGGNQRLQIKGRRFPRGAESGQKTGSISLEKEWDQLVLVLLDERYNPTAMYEADRPAVEAAIRAPGSLARNKRGQLHVSKVKAIGRQVWP
jgi:hypothetical protein